MNKINILFQSSYEHSRMGGQKSLLALIDNLDREFFAPFLTVPYEGELKEIAEQKGINVIVQPLPGMKLANLFRLKKIRDRFVDYIQKNNISIIHTDNDKFAYLATFIAKKAKIKVIFHARVAQPYKYDKLIEPRVDRIVGISDATKSRFKESTITSKFSKIYNGLDCEIFTTDYDKESIRSELNLDTKPVILLFVGQLVITKGLEDIFKAMKVLQESSSKKYQLYIIGSEPEEGQKDYFLNQTIALDLDKSVKFVGQKNNVHEWMQAADIVLFPSHKGEGMGRVPLEAMATGTPVVATNISGVNEAVTNEVGILIEEKNPQDLANAIEKLASDKMLYDRLAFAGRKRAVEVFDIKIHAVNMMNLFQEMVKEK